MREQILSYALKYRGEYAQIHRAIRHNEKWVKQEYEGNYLTILDDAYPKELLDLEDPPYILFYEGSLDLLTKKKMTLIGSRQCSPFACENLECLIQTFHFDTVIVSGVARGVDGMAHDMALKLGYFTIGVIGCGCDVVYPKENKPLYQKIKEKGLLLSEYPKGCAPMAHHFPWRNRILAALCEKCYVIEAKSKSGTMITADYALSLNRDVIAFPYRFNDECGQGCNELIEQGAGIFVR